MGFWAMGELGRTWVGAWGGAWRGAWFGISINYLDGGFVGLVRLDLSIGVWFWMRCGDVII